MLAPDSKVSSSDLPAIAADVLERIRAQAPRVHCITNSVAQNFTANMLLAAGAVPSMTIAPDEIADFVAQANALLINIGTLDAERRAAIPIAIQTARARSLPWLLDPVLVNRSAPRAANARVLVEARPTAVRLNAPEFIALTGQEVDGATLARFAEASGAAVGLTGETDVVFDRGRLACISNGDPMMAKVTAMGCAGSALVAACLAVEKDAWVATASGLLILAVSGEIAAAAASGPGTLQTAILDVLHGMDRGALTKRAKIV
jgi:hydroxyethylthiazole kinase